MSPLVRVIVLFGAWGLWLLGTTRADAGHEFPFYPSFYPHEIRIEVIDPAAAAPRLQDGSLHAYLGGDPFAGAPLPAKVGHVESLGSYVVVTLNPASPFFADSSRRCLASRTVLELLSGSGAYRPHPYPVTPFHADFLHHVDLAESAKREPRVAGWAGAPLRIRAEGGVAEQLVRSGLQPGGVIQPAGADWDARVETVDVAELSSARATHLNGWVGPPWLKAGWFHAYLLHARAIADPGEKQRVEALFQRLVGGAYAGLAERLNLERRLVSLLRERCERVVAGYTVRREPLHVEYSGGVENVAHDAQTGLLSAIFPRTVKLKDFPWNGWLTVGSPTKPAAAWNPVGGFTDPTGRLVWMTVGDPALFPSPHSASWVPNRVTPTVANANGARVSVPEDALVPEHGTGFFRKVGPRRHAEARILYRVLASAFHDGTRLTVADLLHAMSFPYRSSDPVVEASTAPIRERLAGLRALRVETDVLAFGEDKLTYEVPVVEVYVNHRAPDPLEVAAIAPPWTTLPWHLLALMEEAVARGLAAFSREEAERRGVAWLDLVRHEKLKEALASAVEEFGRRSYVPPGLRGFVTPEEAKARWTALGKFYDARRHFLVTNGPYRLHQWSETFTGLQVFRDLTYPRGVGAFNGYAIPLRAYVAKTERHGDELTLQAEVEKVERFGREYRIVTEPFVKKASEQDRRSLPVCHFVVVGSDGAVLTAGTLPATDASTFHIDLKALPRAGVHTILVALSLDDNHVNLPVRIVPWTR